MFVQGSEIEKTGYLGSLSVFKFQSILLPKIVKVIPSFHA